MSNALASVAGTTSVAGALAKLQGSLWKAVESQGFALVSILCLVLVLALMGAVLYALTNLVKWLFTRIGRIFSDRKTRDAAAREYEKYAALEHDDPQQRQAVLRTDLAHQVVLAAGGDATAARKAAEIVPQVDDGMMDDETLVLLLKQAGRQLPTSAKFFDLMGIVCNQVARRRTAAFDGRENA